MHAALRLWKLWHAHNVGNLVVGQLGLSQRSETKGASQMVTMYSTTWCAYCKRLKRSMASEGVEFAEVNIENDPAAADLVMSVNGGNRTVPTLVFDDGSALTNPTIAQVKSQLASIS